MRSCFGANILLMLVFEENTLEIEQVKHLPLPTCWVLLLLLLLRWLLLWWLLRAFFSH
jgi:hypothetical protein